MFQETLTQKNIFLVWSDNHSFLMYVFCYQQQKKSSKHVQFGSVQNK